MTSRPPLAGYNHNVRYRTRVYHVQSEDSGLDNPHVFTHVFLNGMIISSARAEYKELLDDADEARKVRKLMQEQHKDLMKRLRKGEFDDKIIAMVGALEDAAAVAAAQPRAGDESDGVAAAATETVDAPATEAQSEPAARDADLEDAMAAEAAALLAAQEEVATLAPRGTDVVPADATPAWSAPQAVHPAAPQNARATPSPRPERAAPEAPHLAPLPPAATKPAPRPANPPRSAPDPFVGRIAVPIPPAQERPRLHTGARAVAIQSAAPTPPVQVPDAIDDDAIDTGNFAAVATAPDRADTMESVPLPDARVLGEPAWATPDPGRGAPLPAETFAEQTEAIDFVALRQQMERDGLGPTSTRTAAPLRPERSPSFEMEDDSDERTERVEARAFRGAPAHAGATNAAAPPRTATSSQDRMAAGALRAQSSPRVAAAKSSAMADAADESIIVDRPPTDVDGDEERAVDSLRMEPTSYSHVYPEKELLELEQRAAAEATARAPRQRVTGPVPREGVAERHASKVFGEPLPRSVGGYPTPDQAIEKLDAIKHRGSGVYLVGGARGQAPPHPDPNVRAREQLRASGGFYAEASSPQRYTAPRSTPPPGAPPRKKRETGSYEVLGPRSSAVRRALSERTSPDLPPVARPAPTAAGQPAAPPPHAAPTRAAATAAPRRRPVMPATDSNVVVARPAVIIGDGSGHMPPPAPPRRPPAHVAPPPHAQRPTTRPPQSVIVPPVPRAPSSHAPGRDTFESLEMPRSSIPGSVFGAEAVSERSLDEVILAYLAEDSEAEK